MIPGSNILNTAFRAIARQPIEYYADLKTRSTNAIGQYVTNFAAAVCLQGSVQPVPRNLYEAYGLDLQKNYVTVYLSKNVLDVARDITGDQFAYGCKRFQAISKTDWFLQDGWDAILCVEVPKP